ncbi:MAG: hypothetical protein IPH61_15485 [Bacteroidetes bacterium]|nr:hypothetical protein [Bacteroidota bacterium]
MAIVASILTSCKNEKETVYTAFDPGSLDTAFNPGDDFYEYVNAKWIASHPIPADKVALLRLMH